MSLILRKSISIGRPERNLRDESLEAIESVGKVLVETYCADDLDDAWDLEGLHTDLATFWPTELDLEALGGVRGAAELGEKIRDEGLGLYHSRETELTPPVLRQIERQVMLQLVDQRWREHLNEMDHLREGINLRAMGQRDPLIEWQREGFSLFSDMMTGLSTDFVKYIMHVQVVQQPVPVAAAEPEVEDVSAAGPSEPGTTAEPAPAAPAPAAPAVAPARAPARTTNVTTAKAEARSLIRDETTRTPPVSQTVVKDEWDKTPRNAACPCGSGKKFKQCHGR